MERLDWSSFNGTNGNFTGDHWCTDLYRHKLQFRPNRRSKPSQSEKGPETKNPKALGIRSGSWNHRIHAGLGKDQPKHHRHTRIYSTQGGKPTSQPGQRNPEAYCVPAAAKETESD